MLECKLWSVLGTGPAWPLWSAVPGGDKAPGAWRGLERAGLALGQEGQDQGTGRHAPGSAQDSFWQHSVVVVGARAITNSFPLDRWASRASVSPSELLAEAELETGPLTPGPGHFLHFLIHIFGGWFKTTKPQWWRGCVGLRIWPESPFPNPSWSAVTLVTLSFWL